MLGTTILIISRRRPNIFAVNMNTKNPATSQRNFRAIQTEPSNSLKKMSSRDIRSIPIALSLGEVFEIDAR